MIIAPKLFENVDQLIKDKLALAMANRGREVNVLVGVSKVEADLMLRKLRNMQVGLRLPRSTAPADLQAAANEQFMKFGKDYEPKAPTNTRFTVYMVVHSITDLRPSAAAAQAMADFEKGLRRTPF